MRAVASAFADSLDGRYKPFAQYELPQKYKPIRIEEINEEL